MQNPTPPAEALDDELSIDGRARLWLESIPRREGLRHVQMPRHQVQAFLAAATINAGTAEMAKKLQARLSFSASVINVPAKTMLELVEAFVATSPAPQAPEPVAAASPVAPSRAPTAGVDASVADARGAPKAV